MARNRTQANTDEPAGIERAHSGIPFSTLRNWIRAHGRLSEGGENWLAHYEENTASDSCHAESHHGLAPDQFGTPVSSSSATAARGASADHGHQQNGPKNNQASKSNPTYWAQNRERTLRYLVDFPDSSRSSCNEGPNQIEHEIAASNGDMANSTYARAIEQEIDTSTSDMPNSTYARKIKQEIDAFIGDLAKSTDARHHRYLALVFWGTTANWDLSVRMGIPELCERSGEPYTAIQHLLREGGNYSSKGITQLIRLETKYGDRGQAPGPAAAK